jgi:hypothetical protein
MPFLVQTLSTHSIILASISAPVIQGEASRVYRALDDKLSRRSENETIHIVIDVSSFNYTNRFPVERFVKVISKLYEDWHYQRTLVLWLAVDGSYIDTAKYLVQTQCLPVYLRTTLSQVFKQIDATFGETGSLQVEESQGL